MQQIDARITGVAAGLRVLPLSLLAAAPPPLLPASNVHHPPPPPRLPHLLSLFREALGLLGSGRVAHVEPGV